MSPSFHAAGVVPRANRPPGSSFAADRLKPLTRLVSPSDSVSRSYYVESPSTERSGFSAHSSQSNHSRRSSMTSQSHPSPATANGAHPVNLHGLPTTQASIPKLTLGSRLRVNQVVPDQDQPLSKTPHPYDLILPGEEIQCRKPPHKARTMSVVATGPAHSTSIASVNRSRSFRIGARRFTQTANTSHPSVNQVGSANATAALHARRYSSIAREPSAATVSRGSSHAGDLFEDDDPDREPKRITRHDTQVLLVSFNSLIGRDGGGEAVGNLLAFILQGGLSKVKVEITALVGDVLRAIPTLRAAYVSVYLHEIAEQIQKIGELLWAEPDLKAIYDSIYARVLGLAAPSLVSSPPLSLHRLWKIIVEKFTTLPIYQSAILKVIETLSKLILVSEELRVGLWTSISQALSQPHGPQPDDCPTVSMGNFLGLLFSAIEQLSGSSIRPLVKSFLSWFAIVDDVLMNLAEATITLLNQTHAPSNGLPGDYVSHPFGYIYSPTESNAKLDIVVQTWLAKFKEEPNHRNAFEQLNRSLNNVWSGILGNSTFNRFSRDLLRVWKGIVGKPSKSIPGTGLEGGLECLKTLASAFLEIPIGDVITQHNGVNLSIRDLILSAIDILPVEISFSTHSRLFPSDCSFQSSTQIEMKGLQLGIKNACSVCVEDSNSGSNHFGTAMISTILDLAIDFIPKNTKLPQLLMSLPLYGGSSVTVSSADIKFLNSSDLKISDESLKSLKDQVHQKVKITVQDYLDSFFKIWFAVKSASSTKNLSAQKHRSKIPASRITQQPSHHLHRLPETHGNARDRFKATIRNLTGIKTGSVLTQLQNPLSGPGSPLASPPAGEDPECKRKRRQSMADYLTDISRADSTLPENIQRPPVADCHRRHLNSLNLPNVFDEDEDDLPSEFPTMARSLSLSARGDTTSVDKIIRPIVSSKADLNSVLSHRGGMPNFPMVEMSYEAYEKAEASIDDCTNAPIMELGGQEVSSMAQSLSELATRDTTIEEAIAHPPTVVGSQDQAYLQSDCNMTMDKITRHLSGLTDLTEQHVNTVTPQQRVLRRNATPPELSSKIVMANVLPDSAMEDNTLPETQATGHLSGPVNALGVPVGKKITSLPDKEIVAMRSCLSEVATTDTTLSRNIAAPPGTQHVYRGSALPNSYTGVKPLRSMSATLNEAIEKDYTTPEAQAELYRNARAQADQVIALSENEMKLRRESFKLTKEAMKDTTLLESIRNPPVVQH